jgi:PBP1b-binding outer membrane lipoprotein LpoB
MGNREKKKMEGKKMKRLMGLMLGLLFLAGCGGYWMVTDPTTKNIYYTEEVEQSKSSGAVKFIDAKTGTQVNLQNSEVKEVTKEEFKAAVGKK